MLNRVNPTTFESAFSKGIVTIGGTGVDFLPELRISLWDDECHFRVAKSESQVQIVEKGERIEGPDFNFYPIANDEEHPEGGFEFEVVLHQRPKSNVVSFAIETEGLNFFYQPALTKEEIDKGFYRPENVVGSYAVYHKTKKHGKYKTGKAFHIYRPKAIDAKGNWVWGELAIDEKAGILTVTLDEGWLDKAAYPVLVDPTFGYTTAGSGYYTGLQTVASWFPGVNGNPESVTWYGRFTSSTITDRNAKVAIYTKTADDAGSFVAEGEELTGRSTITWYTSNLTTSPGLSSVNNYWLCFRGNFSSCRIYYDSSDAGKSGGLNLDYGDGWPSNIENLSLTPIVYSIYCTYEEIITFEPNAKSESGTNSQAEVEQFHAESPSAESSTGSASLTNAEVIDIEKISGESKSGSSDNVDPRVIDINKIDVRSTAGVSSGAYVQFADEPKERYYSSPYYTLKVFNEHFLVKDVVRFLGSLNIRRRRNSAHTASMVYAEDEVLAEAFQLAENIAVFKGDELKFSGYVTGRDFNSRTVSAISHEQRLAQMKTPMQWVGWNHMDLAAVVRDHLNHFHFRRFSSKNQWEAMDRLNVDIDTDPGSVFLEYQPHPDDPENERPKEYGYLTTKIDLGENALEGGRVARWSEIVGEAVRITIQSRSADTEAGLETVEWGPEMTAVHVEGIEENETHGVPLASGGRWLQVRVNLYTNDQDTPHRDSDNNITGYGFTPELQGLEIIWRSPSDIRVGKIPDNIGITVQDFEFNRMNHLASLVELCDFYGYEFRVRHDFDAAALYLDVSEGNLGWNHTKNGENPIILRHGDNAEITTFRDNTNNYANVLHCWGAGEGAAKLYVILKDQNAIDLMGGYEIHEDYERTDIEDELELITEGQVELARRLAPDVTFEVLRATTEERYGLYDRITVVHPRNGFVVDARIEEEQIDYSPNGETVRLGLNEFIENLFEGFFDRFTSRKDKKPPPTPRQFTAQPYYGYVVVSWFGNEERYVVRYRKKNQSAWNYVSIPELRFVHSPLQVGEEWEYQVAAIKNNELSGWSAVRVAKVAGRPVGLALVKPTGAQLYHLDGSLQSTTGEMARVESQLHYLWDDGKFGKSIVLVDSYLSFQNIPENHTVLFWHKEFEDEGGVGPAGGEGGEGESEPIPWDFWMVKSDGTVYRNGELTEEPPPIIYDNGTLTISSEHYYENVDEVLIIPWLVPDRELLAWYQADAPFYEPSPHIDANSQPIRAADGAILMDRESMKAYQSKRCDFDDYGYEAGLGITPNDWQEKWKSTWSIVTTTSFVAEYDATIGKNVLKGKSVSASVEPIITWKRTSLLTDADVTVTFKTDTVELGYAFLRIYLRASGAHTQDSRAGFYVEASGSNILSIRHRYHDSHQVLGNAAVDTWQTNTWYCIRFAIQGNQVMAKVWEYGQSEPDQWRIAATFSLGDPLFDPASKALSMGVLGLSLPRLAPTVRFMDLRIDYKSLLINNRGEGFFSGGLGAQTVAQENLDVLFAKATSTFESRGTSSIQHVAQSPEDWNILKYEGIISGTTARQELWIHHSPGLDSPFNNYWVRFGPVQNNMNLPLRCAYNEIMSHGFMGGTGLYFGDVMHARNYSVFSVRKTAGTAGDLWVAYRRLDFRTAGMA